MAFEVSPRIPVGVEQGDDGHCWAFALNGAGCAGTGASMEEAVEVFQRRYLEWLRFLQSVGEPVPPRDAVLEIAVDEWIATDADVSGGDTIVLFRAEYRPLEDDELQRGVRLLGDLRGRVLARIRAIPRREVDAALDAPVEGGMTVRDVLEELARAQWWTLSRLGATPMAGTPEATLGRLDAAMALVVQHLGHLDPARRDLWLELDGEEWTPRKVLRRLLWLEWTLGRAALRGLDAAAPNGAR
ncbi:MAG TPA: hypothetical protein VFS20_02805 [Longimicrobium sp.]|nr:hypothetical protein [Longimicrobium sp.]